MVDQGGNEPDFRFSLELKVGLVFFLVNGVNDEYNHHFASCNLI
jgi:hypothetical protein